jgi:hypothetical protein
VRSEHIVCGVGGGMNSSTILFSVLDYEPSKCYCISNAYKIT